MNKSVYQIMPDDEAVSYKGRKYGVKWMGKRKNSENWIAFAIAEGTKSRKDGSYVGTFLEVVLNEDGRCGEVIAEMDPKDFGVKKRSKIWIWHPDLGMTDRLNVSRELLSMAARLLDRDWYEELGKNDRQQLEAIIREFVIPLCKNIGEHGFAAFCKTCKRSKKGLRKCAAKCALRNACSLLKEAADQFSIAVRHESAELLDMSVI